MKRGVIIAVYAASILSHVGVALGLSRIEPPPPAPVRVEVRLAPPAPPPPVEVPAPAEEPAPSVEAPAAPEAPAPKPKVAPKPAPPATPPPPAAVAPPAFGVAMGNASGPGGVAVPVGVPSGVPNGTGPTRRRESRSLAPTAAAAPQRAAVCAGESRKPKPLSMPHPRYTSAAREAGVEGRVRVEITIGAGGEVQSARVLSSLGHGLDEAALEAARAARFDAALECGRAVSATFTVSIRFTQ